MLFLSLCRSKFLTYIIFLFSTKLLKFLPSQVYRQHIFSICVCLTHLYFSLTFEGWLCRVYNSRLVGFSLSTLSISCNSLVYIFLKRNWMSLVSNCMLSVFNFGFSFGIFSLILCSLKKIHLSVMDFVVFSISSPSYIPITCILLLFRFSHSPCVLFFFSRPYMTTGKIMALARQTFVGLL